MGWASFGIWTSFDLVSRMGVVPRVCDSLLAVVRGGLTIRRAL